ncbi:MAG: SDR family oxidoreductase, partial [Rhodobacteraceae bacterium]|nr:SDR family oxidoreductase [Paracoccaceae bacterium]
EIALLLAGRGWPVVAFGVESRQISSMAENAIPGLLEEARARGLPLEALEADVTREDDVARVMAHAEAAHGRIWAVVNNAAIGPLGTGLDTAPDRWDRIMAVNLRGPYLTARAVIPHMARSGGGVIVNVGSGAGWGKPNMAAYAASKGGLHTLTTALALDHFHDRIRVNTVIPGGGGIMGGMSLGRVDGDMARLRAAAVGTVAGRHATGEDLGRTIAFLISDEAEVISGTVIDVGCFANQGSSSPLKRPTATEVT